MPGPLSLRDSEGLLIYYCYVVSRVKHNGIYTGKKQQNERLEGFLFFFWSVMITNSNMAGRGYNDLFVMQIPVLSSLPKINNSKQMTICRGAQLSKAGSLVLTGSYRLQCHRCLNEEAFRSRKWIQCHISGDEEVLGRSEIFLSNLLSLLGR